MAQGMNKVFLFGNLGDDPQLRSTERGMPYLRFRLATTEKWKNKQGEPQERTDWHNVQIWGKRGEALANYLSKGSRVMVEGRVETSSYEKDGQRKYFTNVNARDVYLIDRAKPRPDHDGGPYDGSMPFDAGRKTAPVVAEAQISA